MTATRRTTPLTAAALPPAPPAAPRDERFDDGIRTLRVGGASLRLEERLLMVIGGVLAPLGVIVVLLGWWGAANTPYVFEQLPYLISGGLLGIGLVFLGAFFYFAHWMTQLVKEHRVQSVAMLEALQQLQAELEHQRATAPSTPLVSANGSGSRTASAPLPTASKGPALVATARGTMAHRRDCVVVAGKADLRPVGPGDGLAPCKLCDPYGPDDA